MEQIINNIGVSTYKLFSLTSKEVNLIAPDPISKTKPIVKTIKKIIAILNPKTLTLYNVKAIGNSNNISRSNTKINKPTMKK